eukprot:1008908-Pleurochrysis_carterae.AAC.9
MKSNAQQLSRPARATKQRWGVQRAHFGPKDRVSNKESRRTRASLISNMGGKGQTQGGSRGGGSGEQSRHRAADRRRNPLGEFRCTEKGNASRGFNGGDKSRREERAGLKGGWVPGTQGRLAREKGAEK